MDRIDGGLSILLRVPGVLPHDGVITASNIRVDAYLPPREVELHRKELERAIGRLAQIFGQEIACCHLKHFEERCRASAIEPPHRTLPVSETAEVSAHLRLIPEPVDHGGAYFQFKCYAPGVLESYLAKLDDSDFDRSDSVDWDAAGDICDRIAASTLPQSSTPHRLHLGDGKGQSTENQVLRQMDNGGHQRTGSKISL